MNNFSTIPLRFRVWDKELKRFVCYSDIYGAGSEVEKIDFDFKDMATLMNLSGDIWDNFIISQDTGLKDKNGKSIYTGDILNINGHYVFVNFDYGRTFFENPREGIAQDGNRASLYDTKGEYIDGEVVGDLWQNPKLLEEV